MGWGEPTSTISPPPPWETKQPFLLHGSTIAGQGRGARRRHRQTKAPPEPSSSSTTKGPNQEEPARTGRGRTGGGGYSWTAGGRGFRDRTAQGGGPATLGRPLARLEPLSMKRSDGESRSESAVRRRLPPSGFPPSPQGVDPPAPKATRPVLTWQSC